MSNKTVDAEKRPHNGARAKLSPHRLAVERRTLLDQLNEVQLAVDVARALITDDDDAPDEKHGKPCVRAMYSLIDAVEILANAVKESRRK